MPRRRHFLTIGQKLTIALVTLAIALTAISLVVVDQVGRMRDDAHEVFEETGEASLASRLANELHAVHVLLAAEPASGPSTTADAKVAESLANALAAAARFAAASTRDAEPGSAHESEEMRLLDEIRHNVTGLDGLDRATKLARIATSERLAEALADATRTQAATEYADLEAAAAHAAVTIWGTVTLCALALVGLLFCISRCVTRPLALLREGADRFGSGDLSHRIAIPSRDEIGDLSRAFDRMAERLERSHTDLESRVRERTAQFLRAARLADLGTLAAGFAHEINNPLASIASSAEGLERRIASGSVTPAQEAEYLRTIASEAYRARGITSRLVDLARQEPGEHTLVDLRTLVLEHARIVESELGKRAIMLWIDVPDEVPPVLGNRAELTQALLNLVLNARDASPHGGTIRITVAVDRDVTLRVVDQGPGIPLQDLERIFEPFFTTKPPGQGTGLGLALAHAIAESHRGSLRARNGEGGGAIFELTLPIARSDAA